jgi:hypothetical protein
MRKPVNVLLVLGLLAAALAGCLAYVPPPPLDAVYAPGPPPEPLVEVVPAIPFPGAVWVGGTWGYGHSGYYWNRGYWGRPPHPGGAWVPGRWHQSPRGYYWHPGRWR